MATKKRLIDANALMEEMKECAITRQDLYCNGYAQTFIENAPTVDAVEVPDKELLRAIKLLIKQYEHFKNSEYVHSPVAHALYHTWRQVDERRTDHV